MKKKPARGRRWGLSPQALKAMQTRPVPSRNDCRVLIWIDATPQRKAESKAYADLKKKITAAAAEVERFQQVTLPEFERWHAQTFGVLLTEQRSLQSAMEQKMALVEEVRIEQWRRGGSEAAAYQRVLRARSRREAGLADEGDGAAAKEDDEESSFDAIFRDVVRNLFGVEPEVMDEQTRQTVEEAVRRKMAGEDPTAARPPKKKEKPPTPKHAALEARCKQIYRLLVMRLHPDTGAAPSAQSRQLWHDLQDAWQRRDLERLELLQAILELQDGGGEAAFAAASLDRLRRIVRDLARAWRDMQKHWRALKRHPASQLADPKTAKLLAASIRADLRYDIRELQREVIEVDSLIEHWQKSAPRKKSRGLGQEEFGF